MTFRYSRKILLYLMFLIFLVASLVSILVINISKESKENYGPFRGERAFKGVEYQLNLGPRTMGSLAHDQVIEWIQAELNEVGWTIVVQTLNWRGRMVRNVIASWGNGEPWVILGSHYDSRMVADRDPTPSNRTLPVPGANDGASGVAVLLEIARVLPGYFENPPEGIVRHFKQVWLVFFDAEDNGKIPGWDWILGSQAFVHNLEGKPEAAVIVDMVGDSDLNIHMEKNSTLELREEIWQVASQLGYGKYFIPQPKYGLTDDHVSFLQAGIPAVDIIDFNYPFWHTTLDTLDKISAESLRIVGEVLLKWLTR